MLTSHCWSLILKLLITTIRTMKVTELLTYLALAGILSQPITALLALKELQAGQELLLIAILEPVHC
ncbi:MAG: hypothetical protein EBT69_04355 [Verrucomicrobia bacterium]|nr:hypothetical protein [Verrucomicrobiota bacterium]